MSFGVQGVAIALPTWLASGSVLCWIYPAYYVALLGGRQIEDEKMCLAKYGAKWESYIKAVPYRIIPFLW